MYSYVFVQNWVSFTTRQSKSAVSHANITHSSAAKQKKKKIFAFHKIHTFQIPLISMAHNKNVNRLLNVYTAISSQFPCNTCS